MGVTTRNVKIVQGKIFR